jgi:hypothetical protein
VTIFPDAIEGSQSAFCAAMPPMTIPWAANAHVGAEHGVKGWTCATQLKGDQGFKGSQALAHESPNGLNQLL